MTFFLLIFIKRYFYTNKVLTMKGVLSTFYTFPLELCSYHLETIL